MEYLQLDEKDFQSFELTQTAISNEKIIGTCELGYAEIQLLNDSNEYSSYKNKWIKTPLGSLYVYDVEPVQERVSIKLKCYDIKYALDVEYNKNDYILLFPCTLKQWRNVIFDMLRLKHNDEDFPNSNLLLPEHPYVEEGCSVRAVIKTIAEAAGSWVETNNNDIFSFNFVSDATNLITEDRFNLLLENQKIIIVDDEIKIKDWIELTTEQNQTEPVNVVVLGRGDVEDIVIYPEELPENPVEFRINNNYILDPQTPLGPDRRYDVIQPIYERVKGFSYIPFTMRTQDINVNYIKLGSKINYLDIWGNMLQTIVMTKTVKWLGNDLSNGENYELNISCEEVKETKSEYSYASKENPLGKIGVYVDKSKREILSEVSDLYVTKENESADVLALGTRISQTAKSINLSVVNGDASSGITLTTTKEDGTSEQVSGTIEMSGLVKFTNLTDGSTTISGSNIKTGTINCDLLNGGMINGQTINGGTISGTTINTGQNCIVGDNLYVGQNQTAGAGTKYLFFTDTVYIQKFQMPSGDSMLQLVSGGKGMAITPYNIGANIPAYFPNIKSGTCTLNSTRDTWVDFGVTFERVPKVFLTCQDGNAYGYAGIASGITTTGFNGYIGWITSNPNKTATYSWLAIDTND